jgi:glycosyltransferase involved in cell wall biosynthesis
MPTLSLCMIARDEADFLAGCLESALPWVDEVVLLDTGSLDHTVQIAESLGARVLHYVWQGDFASARNAALAAATGDFVLVLDADERLAPQAGLVLRRAIEDPAMDAAFLPLHDADRLDARSEQILSGAARLGEPQLLPRLFRRLPELRWQGAIHEVPAGFLQERSGRIRTLPAPLLHFGNVPSVRKARQKALRNIQILRRELLRRPLDSDLRSHLAQELAHQGEAHAAWREARTAYEQLRHSEGNATPIRTLSTFIFLALQRGDVASARAALDWLDERGLDHPNFGLLAGSLCLLGLPADEARIPPTIAALDRALGQSTQLFLEELLPGATGLAAARLKGELHLMAGAPGLARPAFQQALHLGPSDPAARAGLVRALLLTDRVPEALSACEPLLSAPFSDGWALAAEVVLRLGQVDQARTFAARVAGPWARPRCLHEFSRFPALLAAWPLLGRVRGGAPRQSRLPTVDQPGAAGLLAAWIGEHPTDATAWGRLALALARTGWAEGARLAESVALAGGAVEPNAYAARAVRSAHSATARSWARFALALYPDDVHLRSLVAGYSRAVPTAGPLSMPAVRSAPIPTPDSPTPIATHPNAPRLTLALMVHNQAAYCAEAVETALGQTWPNLDILISDDASVDDSFAVLQATLARLPRSHHSVRLIQQSTNLRFGHLPALASQAEGRFLVVAHGDDRARPDRVAQLFRIAESSGAAYVASNAIQLDRDEHVLGLYLPPSGQRSFTLRDCVLSAWRGEWLGSAAAFRTDLFSPPFVRHGLLPMQAGWDHLLPVRAALTSSVAWTPEPLFLYRRHPAQRSRKVADFEGGANVFDETLRAHGLTLRQNVRAELQAATLRPDADATWASLLQELDADLLAELTAWTRARSRLFGEGLRATWTPAGPPTA